MNEAITILLFIILIVSGISALRVRDLVAAGFILMAFSFAAAVIYALMGAPDVAFTEAVVGAGVSGVFLLSALFYMDRRSKD
jgi:energy-converting hydrogenase B subunit D